MAKLGRFGKERGAMVTQDNDSADCDICEAHDRALPCPECQRNVEDEQADWREDR
jgi:hypothetical protein